MIPLVIIGGVQGFQFATIFLMGLILIVTLVVSAVISHLITRSLVHLTKNIDRVSKGDLNVELDSSDIEEINALTESINRVMASLKLAIHKVGVKHGDIFHETMKAAKEVEEKYYRLVQNLDAVVWETNAEGKIMYCSSQVADILGYTPDEMKSTSIFTHLSPSDEKTLKTIMTPSKATADTIQHFDAWWMHKNNKQVYLQTSAVPLFSSTGEFEGYLGVNRDQTDWYELEQKHNELVRKYSKIKQRARTLLQQKETTDQPNEETQEISIQDPSPNPVPKVYLSKLPLESDAMYMFNTQLNILDCSPSMLHHLGYSKEEMLTLSVPDVDVFETKDSFSKKLSDIKKQGSMRVKTMHKRKDGSSFLVRQDIHYDEQKDVFTCYVKEELI